MSELDPEQQDRRKVIKALGTSALALPVLGLTGCGGGGDEAGSSAAGKAVEDAAETMEKAAGDTAEAVSEAADTMAQEGESAMAAAEETASEAINAAKEQAEDVAAKVADTAQEAAKVDEDGTQARSLGYRHDASTIDSAAQPRYSAGQQCSNCALYQGGDEPWGACPIFAGQLVKSTGWCTAYVARS